MRIGVFGGTFDPVHCGHVLLATSCQRQAQLDRIILVPAAHQPLKTRSPKASAVDRIAMLQLAFDDGSTYEISSLEVDRGGRSYTVDTLRELAAEYPQAALFFLMGADALADLPKWREPEEICKLAQPLVVRRNGAPEPSFDLVRSLMPADRLTELASLQVEMPSTPISSSDVQRRIALGIDWQSLVPPPVADYIMQRGLYGAA